MKTRRRNLAAAASLFTLAVIVSGFASPWLERAFGLSLGVITLIGMVWGSMSMIASIALYYELEERREVKHAARERSAVVVTNIDPWLPPGSWSDRAQQ